VLFSYEEALGYCVGDAVADKDGISAAVVFVEMAAALRKVHGKSVMEYLQRLYALYGQFVSHNGYVISRQPAVTDSIFARLRTSSSPSSSSSGGGSGGAPGQYWAQAAGVAIVSVKDVTLGYDSASPTRRADLPLTPDSHMIMYAFANGCTVTLRTSGTEPKIKWYAEMRGDAGRSASELAATLKAFVDRVVDEMLQPEARGLQRM
jgi:phosphoglucomutase